LNFKNDDQALEALDIRVNRIPGMMELAHKKATGMYLNKFCEYYTEHFKFFPKTYLYPEDYEQFEQDFKKGRVYIAKPTSGS
jgi:hypothetical protein